RQQAAQQLGWPEGTVAGRLVRARALLAKRLLHGVHGDCSVAPLLGDGQKAAVPLALAQTTIDTATWIAAGNAAAPGMLSAQSLTLAKGVLGAMFWHKVKLIGFTAVAAMALAGVGGRTVQILAARQQHPQPADVKDDQAKDKKPGAAVPPEQA